MTRHDRLCTLLALLVTVALLGGCAAKMASRERAMAPASAPPGSTQSLAARDEAGGGEAKEAPATEAAPSAVADRKIITTGSMTIQVKDLDAALTELQRLIKQTGGFFANKTVSAEENWRTAEIVIRVPAAHFEQLHQGARALGEVKREDQQGEDVTRQWQDLEARVKIRQVEEQSLLKLMEKQARLADLLEVEKRLWEVREQIERAQGELRYLRDKVTLATLTLTLNEEIPAGVGTIGPWNLGYHIRNAFRAFVSGMGQLLTALIYIALPGALVWVPLLLIILWIRRVIRRRRAARQVVS
jgi:hypothetical protein